MDQRYFNVASATGTSRNGKEMKQMHVTEQDEGCDAIYENFGNEVVHVFTPPQEVSQASNRKQIQKLARYSSFTLNESLKPLEDTLERC